MMDYFQRHLVSNLRMSSLLLLLVSFALIALVACGPPAESVPTATPAPAGELQATQVGSDAALEPIEEEEDSSSGIDVELSYPPPLAPTAEVSYPADGLPGPEPADLPEDYPAPTEEVFQEPRFRIDVPVSSATTVITGQAPPNVVLAVVDVTYNGGLLGVGNSQADGQFSIDVKDLVEGNRIGITFGALEPDMTIEDMTVKYFPHRGEGYMNLPNVGVLLDTVLVEQ
jgi:hypothetical protein